MQLDDNWVPAEHGDERPSNHSANPHLSDIIARRIDRRTVMKGGVAAAVAGLFASTAFGRAAFAQAPAQAYSLLGFEAIPVGEGDEIVVPEGYRAHILAPWGEPISGHYPPFSLDNTAADALHQAGSHHDGMHFFPIVGNGPYEGSSTDGFIVRNYEYVEPRFMHASMIGMEAGSGTVRVVDGQRDDDEVLKEIYGHGVAIFRTALGEDGNWHVVRDPRNRRITGNTPMQLAGPVGGSDFVRTKYSPDGTMTRGTLNNCAHGVTPWNTYLTCEENWAGYFVNRDAERPREHTRYGVATANGRYRWELAASGDDQFVRFDVSTKGASSAEDYRNEVNTFGYVVEIDPWNQESTPVKHTAMGRFAHEGIVFGPAIAGRPVVAYSGDDATNEYIYKYVSREAFDPATAGGHLLDDGRLYVAKFNEDGSGEWLALVHGENGLTAENGFHSQADVLVNTRLAADFVGATKMDRPEWGAVDPTTGVVYFTLTNHTSRAADATDAANPRGPNLYGHIIRWREADDHHESTTFEWDIFLLAGDEETGRGPNGEPLGPDNIFGSPDGLWFDSAGRMWIQTDIGESQQNVGVNAPFGNNQMLAADPRTGEVKRFLTGPIGQEITGVITTPDRRTMFINVQHPGATATPAEFAAGNYRSNWAAGSYPYPRSATVVITRIDGGEIGS